MWCLRQSVFGNLRCRMNTGILIDLLQENRGLLFSLIFHHVGLDFGNSIKSLALG